MQGEIHLNHARVRGAMPWICALLLLVVGCQRADGLKAPEAAATVTTASAEPAAPLAAEAVAEPWL